VITHELAIQLREAGLPWEPSPGDRFAIPTTDLGREVFVVSDMTIEVREEIGGPLITFNGTTEWALDSIPASRVLWLPREDQLREALGERFSRLEALPDGFVVVLDDGRRAADIDAERAYARAVLLALG
jgi:hypothetical protein